MSKTAPRKHLPTSPFPPPPEIDHPTYKVGQRVCHDRFGLGRVVGAEGTIAVSVDFGTSIQRVTLPTPRLFAL